MTSPGDPNNRSTYLDRPLRTKREAARDIFRAMLDAGVFFEDPDNPEPIPDWVIDYYPEALEELWEARREAGWEMEHRMTRGQP